MLILITGAYCGIVWLVFFKLEWLPWNKKSRTGAIAVGVVVLTAIIIGLYQGSPGSTLPISVQSRVVQISSGVNGRVIKIHVVPNRPLKRGDPLFTVDPEPYQNEVGRLNAQLAQAQSGVVQMEQTLKAAEASATDIEARLGLARGVDSRAEGEVKAAVETAEAAVVSASEAVRLAQADWERNEAQVQAANESAEANLRAQQARRAQAELEEKRSKQLLGNATISQNEYDIRKRNLETSIASEESLRDVLEQTRLAGSQQTDTRRTAVATSKSQLASAEAQLTRTRLTGQDQVEKASTDVVSLTAQLESTRAEVAKAEAWLAPTVDGEHVSVRQVRDALGTAKFNLAQTVTYAPSDGFVSSMALAEGSYARALAVMSFVSTEHVFVTAPIAQNSAGNIQPGDAAEVVIKSYPGAVLTGKVDALIFATGEAQLKPGSLALADQPLASQNVLVKIVLDDDPDHPIQFGMTGSAAVYTDTAKPFQIIRKIILRMDTLKNFLF